MASLAEKLDKTTRARFGHRGMAANRSEAIAETVP